MEVSHTRTPWRRQLSSDFHL